MYLEYFNGWQQLDLDTNLDKSTSRYLVDVHEKRDNSSANKNYHISIMHHRIVII